MRRGVLVLLAVAVGACLTAGCRARVDEGAGLPAPAGGGATGSTAPRTGPDGGAASGRPADGEITEQELAELTRELEQSERTLRSAEAVVAQDG
ncbi:hypothetical protein [Micromonospora maritima]|uniref:hypothetical protein n=1 Tax=Micromonospora maritima TaxID=986711 RepID=UPI0037B71065